MTASWPAAATSKGRPGRLDAAGTTTVSSLVGPGEGAMTALYLLDRQSIKRQRSCAYVLKMKAVVGSLARVLNSFPVAFVTASSIYLLPTPGCSTFFNEEKSLRVPSRPAAVTLLECLYLHVSREPINDQLRLINQHERSCLLHSLTVPTKKAVSADPSRRPLLPTVSCGMYVCM